MNSSWEPTYADLDRLYMFDGLYQSVGSYFLAHLLFSPATFNSKSGLQVDDAKRMGIYIATPNIILINLYFLMNTYRWDRGIIFVCILSVLFIVGWTGIYTSFTASFQFFHGANQVFQQLTFWALLFVTVVVCLLPRFAIKAYQKIHLPYDIDVIREQVIQGRFKHLEDADPSSPSLMSLGKKADSSSASESSGAKPADMAYRQVSEDQRPIYPPSVAPTATTGPRNPHSTQNSDDSTPMPVSATKTSFDRPRISLDRPRPSYERFRSSMDQLRPSFEASTDMTSAAQLARMESSHSIPDQKSREPSRLRHQEP